MKVLALDTATRTGWALYASSVTTSGVFNCGIRTKPTATIPADHPGKRFFLFRSEVREIIRMNRPNLIVYEAIVGGRSAGGNTSLIQKGLEAILLMEAYQKADVQIPVWTFSPGTIKKWATGNGTLTHESKAEMMRLAFGRFTDQTFIMKGNSLDDNQCDALWLLDLAMAVLPEVIAAQPSDLMDDRVLDSLTKLAQRVTRVKWER